MPKFYLLRPGNTYSDFADYPETPEERTDGEWVEGVPAGLSSFRPLADQLDELFSQQSEDLQAQFSTLRASVNLELSQGRLAIAKRVIEMAQIPEELEAQRQALLALFPPT